MFFFLYEHVTEIATLADNILWLFHRLLDAKSDSGATVLDSAPPALHCYISVAPIWSVAFSGDTQSRRESRKTN